MQNLNLSNADLNTFPELRAYWNFSNIQKDRVPDLSANDNYLFSTGRPNFINDSSLNNVVELNGRTQWLSTKAPIVATDQSFSITAWVRLNGNLLGGNIDLGKGQNALTAVSQDSDTHAGFYLGIRKYKVTAASNNHRSIYRWCFALAPIAMDMPGIHASSKCLLNSDDLDRWILLVAVSDVENRCVQLHLPSLNETQVTPMQDSWKLWNSTKGFQIGRGQWDKQIVDQWPGSIGPVRVFRGVLSFEQSQLLYYEDLNRKI